MHRPRLDAIGGRPARATTADDATTTADDDDDTDTDTDDDENTLAIVRARDAVDDDGARTNRVAIVPPDRRRIDRMTRRRRPPRLFSHIYRSITSSTGTRVVRTDQNP